MIAQDDTVLADKYPMSMEVAANAHTRIQIQQIHAHACKLEYFSMRTHDHQLVRVRKCVYGCAHARACTPLCVDV